MTTGRRGTPALPRPDRRWCAVARKRTPSGTADPVWPNEGVANHYREQLQGLVQAMAQDLLYELRAAWKDGGGIATDRAPRDAVGVIFRDPRGYVLLLKRSDGSGWSWPGGGVEPGETHRQAALRECWEEMGIRWPDDVAMTVVNIQGGPVRYVTVVVDVSDTFAPRLNDEHHDWHWMLPETAYCLPNLFPGVSNTLLTMNAALEEAAHAMDAKKMGARPKPSTPKLLDTAMKRFGTKWNKKLETGSEQLARAFAANCKAATEAAMKRTLTKAGMAVKFKPSKGMTAAYDAVVAENVGLIRTIPQKFLGDVQVAVWQSVMQGSDLATLTKQLHEKYGVAWRRASLIARDQNAKAKAAMERQRRKELGITHATWLHSHAGKVPRETHVKMDGQDYEIDKGMWDSAVQKFVWPGTEIECKCGDRAKIPGFE